MALISPPPPPHFCTQPPLHSNPNFCFFEFCLPAVNAHKFTMECVYTLQNSVVSIRPNHSSPQLAINSHWKPQRRRGAVCLTEEMGIEGRKLRLLCLHGFRTSGEIMKKQITGRWPEAVLQKLDLVFVDAPFLTQGKSAVEGIFDPPYYEWFQTSKDFSEHQNFDECLAYIEDCMIKNGLFDGLLGFSQGAILAAGLAGMQENGFALTRVSKLKLVVIIGGAKFRATSVVEEAYSSPVQCPSVHFLGDQDFMKEYGTVLLDSFVDPVVIRHPYGHTIPRFGDTNPTLNAFPSILVHIKTEKFTDILFCCADEKGLLSMLSFLERIEKDVEEEREEVILNYASL